MMDVIPYFRFCSSKLFWLKEVLRHWGLNASWRQVQIVEGMTRIELERLLKDKTSRMLVHVARTVPYYQRYFKECGIDASNVKLVDFPIIEKKDIRGREDEFVSRMRVTASLNWSRTSGSTGEPFRFGRSEYDYTYATLWRGLLRFGIRPGDKRVLVKGVDEVAKVSWRTRLHRLVYGFINRCMVVDAHFLAKSEENILLELNRIVRYRPKYFHGYVSSIYLLARTAEEHGIDLSALRVKAVVTESEKCHPFQRELMERVFKAHVVENYGCVEFGMIAQPARDGALCINEDHVLVETDREGCAVITNLDEYAFPLIRFRNGDRLRIGPKHTSLPYRTIVELDGRVAETIHLPRGGSLQGYIVMYPISKHMNVLKAYQVYQPDINHLKIRLLPVSASVPVEVQDRIIREMREITGSQIDLAIEIVSAIPLTKRGKRAFVISDVK